MDKAMKDFWG